MRGSDPVKDSGNRDSCQSGPRGGCLANTAIMYRIAKANQRYLLVPEYRAGIAGWAQAWDVVEVLRGGRTRLATPSLPDVSEDLKQPGWCRSRMPTPASGAGVVGVGGVGGVEPAWGRHNPGKEPGWKPQVRIRARTS